jgi:regulator of chromosome condensation
MGQLGRRIIERRKINGTTPTSLSLRNIVHVGCGGHHSFAVDHKGTVYGWGLNAQGQLGIPVAGEDEGELVENTERIICTPMIVEALSPKNLGGAKVVKIVGGEAHTLFLLDDGRLFSCGNTRSSELGLAGDHPGMQSTTATRYQFISTPVHIPFPPLPTEDDSDPKVQTFQPANNPIVNIAVGTRHNLALSKHGHAYAWGLGLNGQLGLGANTEEQKTPLRIQCIKAKNQEEWEVVDVAAGAQHSFLVVRERASVREMSATRG